MSTGFEHTPQTTELTDDNVREMLVLAERLRESHGGELDDAAIMAVSEATGATPEYVRLAVRMLPEKKKHGFLHQFKAAFLALEPDTRRNVVSGLLAANCALFTILATWSRDPSGLYTAVALILFGSGLWNVSLSKDARSGAMAGALFGGMFFLAMSVFALVFNISGAPGWALIPYLLGGMLGGFLLQKIVSRFQGKLGIKDPIEERRDLLRQLVQLQEKLKSGEQSMTFLSVDVVGSTRMKEMSDPLSIEFTFTEYHNFVETVTRRYGGRVHSTAGDGIISAFDHPQQAWAAARNMQAGVIELNTFRNQTGIPIVLRCGIHSGTIVAPDAGDIKSLNFAHVIDIAAHMQKCAPPGGIAVSEAAARALPGGLIAVGPDPCEAMGVKGVIWAPKKAAPQTAAVPPPTPPGA